MTCPRRLVPAALAFALGCQVPAAGQPQSPAAADEEPASKGEVARAEPVEVDRGYEPVVNWEKLGELPKPADFRPHVEDPRTLEPTLRWLQGLRDSEGRIAQIATGTTQGGWGLNPDHFNTQDFRTWTVEDLNEAHALDLAGLDYASEDLRMLAPLVELRALKLSAPHRVVVDANPDQGLAEVAALPRLEYLSLRAYGLKGSGLFALLRAPALVELDLSLNERLGLRLLPELGELETLRWLALESSFGLDPYPVQVNEAYALADLLAALPRCRVIDFEHIDERLLDSLDATGPYELAVELDVAALEGEDALEVRATLVNTGPKLVRISNYPPKSLNGHRDRFKDGSLLHLVGPDGSWRPLETYAYGAWADGVMLLGELLILEPGERREFSFPLTYDADHDAFVVGRNHGGNEIMHEAYGLPATPGTVTLGLELRSDDALHEMHNAWSGYDETSLHAVRETDWRGAVRSETIAIELKPGGQIGLAVKPE